jgi:hypothetical protein
MSDNDSIRRGDALAAVLHGPTDKDDNRIWEDERSYVCEKTAYRAIRGLPKVQHPYSYIGKDNKPILARDLEDQRDAALARVAELEAACALSGVTLLVETLKYCARDDGTPPENRKRAAKDALATLKSGA